MESNPNNVQNNESEKKRENLNLSESLKLKIIKEINNSLNNNQEPINIPEIMTQEKIRQIDEKDKILNYIQGSEFYVDSKKYSNSVIIGSFCYSITFVCFGIYKSRIITDEYTNIWSLMAMYGGLGQITAGFLELNKKREFSSFLYLIYGIYCLTHYFLRILTDRFGEKDLCMFFLAFFLLSIPAIIYSIKINLFFLLQTSFGSLYFLMRCIGEGITEDILSEQISGIMMIISGVCSFYIFMSQMFNSVSNNVFLPTVPFDVNNNIDIIRKQKKE
jgi:succinate-acetate transporter protein